MVRGRVIGHLWGTRKVDGLQGRKLLLVAVESGERLVVAVDTLDAGVGDRVLVAWGSGARNVLRPGPDNRDVLCDAAIALVEDGASDGEGPAGRGASSEDEG